VCSQHMLRLCLAYSYLARTARSLRFNTLGWIVSICRVYDKFIPDLGSPKILINVYVGVCAKGTSVARANR